MKRMLPIGIQDFDGMLEKNAEKRFQLLETCGELKNCFKKVNYCKKTRI